jgi:hypothetical protein
MFQIWLEYFPIFPWLSSYLASDAFNTNTDGRAERITAVTDWWE